MMLSYQRNTIVPRFVFLFLLCAEILGSSFFSSCSFAMKEELLDEKRIQSKSPPNYFSFLPNEVIDIIFSYALIKDYDSLLLLDSNAYKSMQEIPAYQGIVKLRNLFKELRKDIKEDNFFKQLEGIQIVHLSTFLKNNRKTVKEIVKDHSLHKEDLLAYIASVVTKDPGSPQLAQKIFYRTLDFLSDSKSYIEELETDINIGCYPSCFSLLGDLNNFPPFINHLNNPPSYLQLYGDKTETWVWPFETLVTWELKERGEPGIKQVIGLANTLSWSNLHSRSVFCYNVLNLHEDEKKITEVMSHLDCINAFNAYSFLRKFPEALKYGKVALSKDPNVSEEVYANIGAVCSYLEQWNESLKYYRIAFEKNPDLADFNYIRAGYGCFKLEQWNESLKYYRIAFEKNPNLNGQTYTVAGKVCLELKQWNDAFNYYKIAFEKNPNLPNFNYVDAGYVAYKASVPASALTFFKLFIDRENENTDPTQFLPDTLPIMEDLFQGKEENKKYYEKVLLWKEIREKGKEK